VKSVTLLRAFLDKVEASLSERSGLNKVDPHALLEETDPLALNVGIQELNAKRQRYEAKLQALLAESPPRQDKIDKRRAMILDLDQTIGLLTSKTKSTGADLANEKNHVRLNYRFFLQSLDRTAAAFRQQNKDVRIVICTLVGRWPYESESYFREGQNSIWWMKTGPDTSRTAAEYLARFNNLIRDYAREKGLTLIDADREFANVDREEIQFDFAHLTDVGYRRLAATIYHGLLEQGVVK
jgi:hypothetical protein